MNNKEEPITHPVRTELNESEKSILGEITENNKNHHLRFVAGVWNTLRERGFFFYVSLPPDAGDHVSEGDEEYMSERTRWLMENCRDTSEITTDPDNWSRTLFAFKHAQDATLFKLMFG